MEPRQRPQSKSWMRLAGLGVELGAGVAGLALFGHWIDRHFGSSPTGLITGAVLGLVGGMVNLIRTAMRALPDDHPSGDPKR